MNIQEIRDIPPHKLSSMLPAWIKSHVRACKNPETGRPIIFKHVGCALLDAKIGQVSTDQYVIAFCRAAHLRH